MYEWIIIEEAYLLDQCSLSHISWEVEQRRSDADCFTGFDLVFHIDGAGTVFSYHHDRETRCRGERLECISDLLHESICVCFDIEDHLLLEGSDETGEYARLYEIDHHYNDDGCDIETSQ